MLAGGRQRALGGAGNAGVVVEAEPFGHRDEPRRAELDTERREHRVAGDGEGERERAAAFLAARVAELDPVKRRVGRVREGRLRRRDVRGENSGERDHLERGAGRLHAVQADPGHGQNLPGRGLQRDDAAELGAERGDGGFLHSRRDTRAHGVPGVRGSRREHATGLFGPRAGGEQLAAGAPAQARVERALEPARADDRVGGNAPRFERRPLGARDRADFADDRARRFAQRRDARPGRVGRAFGEHRAVAREQLRALRQRRLAREPLAGAQAGERQRVRPGDPLASFGAAADAQLDGQRERAEQARGDLHRNGHEAVRGAARLAGHAQAGGRRRVHRLVVGRDELVRGDRAARRGIDLDVHRRVFGPGPLPDVPLCERVGRRGPAVGAGDRADREGHGGQCDHRARSPDPTLLLFAQGAVEHGG